MTQPMFSPRSLLFVPGSRPDMIAKVPRWRPDATVIDLEDAVAASDKEPARLAGVSAAAGLQPSGLVVLVRINPFGSPWFAGDLRAVAASPARGVVLPKYESADVVAEIRARLPGAALVIAGLETARGVAGCRGLLAQGVDAAYFGAEDYIADLGGRRTDTGEEVLYARSEVMLAARLAGVGAIDQAVVAIRDDARFTADAEAGKSIGYTGKICVHPRQVELAHQVFTPSPEEIQHARRVLEMAETGAGTVGGEMVDEVHVRVARQLIARAEPRPAQDGSRSDG